MSFTVAVDGPAASGKGTLSRAAARAFGFAYLDTGLLYRAIGAKFLEGVDPVEAALNLDPAVLDDESLRRSEVAQAASKVAAIPDLRAALVDFQRAFAQRAGGAVLDGRDIGTVICPDAQVKLFITANDDIRAERRWRELCARGSEMSLDQVRADLLERDARDKQRAQAPLCPALDAEVIDTSSLSIEEALDRVIAIITRQQTQKLHATGVEVMGLLPNPGASSG